MNTIQKLKQLDIAAQELDTGNLRRRAELNNIRCAIRMIIDTMLEGSDEDFKDILPLVVEIRTRINHLAENVDSAGKHDLFNN